MTTDLAGWRASLTPDRPAVWCDNRWLSYRELDERARRLAARLHDAGVRRGDRVGILAGNHLAHLDLLLAAPKLGFIHAPFNFRLAPEELRALCDDIAPKLVFADVRCAALAECTGRRVIALEQYERWLAEPPPPDPLPQGEGEQNERLPQGEGELISDDPWMILFTGGSTGTPKGAVIPYRQIFANAASTVLAWGLSENDCAIQATPMFHAAVNVLTTPLLYAGGRVVLMPAFEPGDYLKLATQHGATVLFMVPTMYRMLSEHPDFARADLSRVRWAISGGAPCPPALRASYRARGIRFKQGYGMTEAGVNCFAIDAAVAARKPDAVGVPMPALSAVIRAANGAPVARGEVGELTLSGAQVCAGYYRRPRETAETFRDGWLWTGDLARQDEAGNFYIVGRRKEMYISGGENVYPAEVEAALSQCEGVAECAVLGVPHERWGEAGLAAVTPRPGARLTADALRAALKPRLAGYKLPAEFLFLESLPKSAAGKILKPEIRRLFEQGRAVSERGRGARGKTCNERSKVH